MTRSLGLLLAAAAIGLASHHSEAEAESLPPRERPIPETTNSVPHVQIGVEPVPEIAAELLRRVGQIPGVQLRATVISMRGAEGFWVSEDVPLARPDVIVGGREFAHAHPDGSLHASLCPAVARAAVAAGWATPHPWSSRRPGWEGFVMIYTPVSEEELDVVFQLVHSSYAFVTGQASTDC